MAPKMKPVVSIERGPYYRTWRNLAHVMWYFLSHSAMLFWAEMVLVVIGLATTPANKEFPIRGALVSLVLFNAIVSLALTFKAMERHTTEKYHNARRFAIRYFPVLMVVSLPVRIVRFLIRAGKRPQRYPPRIISSGPFRGGDGDHAA